MASLSRAEVAHVAHLARLGLTDEELARLEGQLNHILDQYTVLAELPTDDIPPTAQTIEVETILREDVVTPSLPVEVALAGAPERSGDYFVVPVILAGGATEVADASLGLTRLHAHEMAGLLRAGELSATELLEAHLAVIERHDHALHAWQSLDAPGARAAAAAADERLATARAEGSGALEALPPLLGIPVALKDLVVTRGQPSTAGSRILEGYRGAYDADLAERLSAAGAVVPGKTNMDEFAMGSSTEHCAWGPVANPWDITRVPGGSSGGSAAAVAAYHVPLAVGTDTGGSIRQPAALTGVVGLRPTYGRVSRYGIIAFASSLDQVGPFARDVRDAALLLGVIAGHDPRDSTSAPEPVPDYAAALPTDDDEAAGALRGMRLGLPRQYFVAGMEPGVEAQVRAAVAALAAAGAEIVDIDLPHTAYGLATYYIIAPAEASANLARYDGIRYGRSVRGGDVLADYLATRGGGFGAEVKRRIMLGTYALSAGYYDAYYLKALKVRTLIKGDFDRAFETVDALVAPTSPTVAFGLGARMDDPVAMYLSDACTLPVNVAGLAGLSVPCGLSEGLPVGLQFIGKAFDELTLFRLGRAWEALSADAAWQSLEPTDLALLDDPATPAPAILAAPDPPAGARPGRAPRSGHGNARSPHRTPRVRVLDAGDPASSCR